EWQKFANLRLLYSYFFTHPGTKLLFMGGEIAQSAEWNHDQSLDWHLTQYDLHRGIQHLVKALNAFYRQERALFQYAFDQRGFQWVDYSDRDNSVIIYQRSADEKEDMLIVICHFTPAVRHHYRVGVPYRGQWKEVFNSDDQQFGGSGVLNQGLLQTSPVKYHGRDYSVSLTLPPLAVSILKLEKEISEFELQDIGT